MTLSKEDCVKKVQDLTNKIKDAEEKAKSSTLLYLKKNPEYSKFRSAIQAKLKQYFLKNPLGMPKISITPFGTMCRVKAE